jgi:hypothetical protein
MPAQNLALFKRSHQLAPLLDAISKGSGLPPHLMRIDLASRIQVNPDSLKRSWNRWLREADAGTHVPTVPKLLAIVRAAQDLGWLREPLRGDVRALLEWLHRQGRKQQAQLRDAAAQDVTAFVDNMLRDIDFRQYDVEATLESLFTAFATSVAHHIQKSSIAGDSAMLHDVKRGAEKALIAVADALAELSEQVEENEFVPVDEPDDGVGFEPPTTHPAELHGEADGESTARAGWRAVRPGEK